MSSPEDIKDGLAEIAQGNVTDELDWHATTALSGNDPAACYSAQLIGLCAAHPEQRRVRELERRFKAKFNNDFNIPQWRADIKEERARLNAAAPAAPADHLPGLIVGSNGSPKPNLANAVIGLRHSKLKLRFDDFTMRVTHEIQSLWGTSGAWRDIDDLKAAEYLQHRSINVTSATANEAASILADELHFHTVRDWMASLTWDHTPRVYRLAHEYFGCPDTDWAVDVSMAWMIQAVARIMRPGCMAKYVMVLEGPQDQGKSRALRALTNGHMDGDRGVQWFRDRLPDLHSDDIGLYLQGVWIIEIAELAAIKGTVSWEAVKGFISSNDDTFRRKFGRNESTYPRQCVFAGSTNESEWIADPTGGSRFWPLRAGKIDVDSILRDRDQLWAEAKFYFDEGRPWHLDSAAEQRARAEQWQRNPDDLMIDRVQDAVEKITSMGSDEWTVSEVMDKMNIPDRDRKRFQSDIGRCHAKLKYYPLRSREEGGQQVKRWRKMAAWSEESTDH